MPVDASPEGHERGGVTEMDRLQQHEFCCHCIGHRSLLGWKFGQLHGRNAIQPTQHALYVYRFPVQ